MKDKWSLAFACGFGFIAFLFLGVLLAWQIIFQWSDVICLTPTTITYRKLGKNGRLGNQLWQVCVTLALGQHLRKHTQLLQWPYWSTLFQDAGLPHLFESVRSIDTKTYYEVIPEKNSFAFEMISKELHPNQHIDIDGYRQNIRYFTSIMPHIRRLFRIQPQLKERVYQRMLETVGVKTVGTETVEVENMGLKETNKNNSRQNISDDDEDFLKVSDKNSDKNIKQNLLKSPTKKQIKKEDVKFIGVHIRRGDYVGHPIHEVCTMEYYMTSIHKMRTQFFPTAAIIVISDDKKWCEEQQSNEDGPFRFPNVFVSPFATEEEDFVCLYLCDGKIIPNSTFAWWAAFLDNRYTSQVFLPWPWIKGEFQPSDYADLYLDDPRWTKVDVTQPLAAEIIASDLLALIKSKIHVIQQESKKALKDGEQEEEAALVPFSPNTILPLGAYYQCYKQPHAFIQSCLNFREVFPDTSLVIVSDNGLDYSKISQEVFHATSYTVNPKRNGNGLTTLLNSKEQILIFVRNFIEGANKIKEDFFILLEDDVALVRPPKLSLDVVNYFDLIGNNNASAHFNKNTSTALKRITPMNTYYGGCGGSLFKTAFWKKLDMTKLELQLTAFGELNNNEYHSDMVLSFLCIVNAGRICCGQSMFPTEFAERAPEFGAESFPAILHQYKDLYDQAVTSSESILLQTS